MLVGCRVGEGVDLQLKTDLDDIERCDAESMKRRVSANIVPFQSVEPNIHVTDFVKAGFQSRRNSPGNQTRYPTSEDDLPPGALMEET